VKTITVPPYSEMELVGHVDIPQDSTWLIEGIDCPVLVVRAIVAPDQCNVVVREVNTRVNTSETLQEYENC